MDTRKIKSRFRRDHLIKLANDLLKEELVLKSETKPWFELRSGHKVEELADCVFFKEVVPYHDEVDSKNRYWHTVNLVFGNKVITAVI